MTSVVIDQKIELGFYWIQIADLKFSYVTHESKHNIVLSVNLQTKVYKMLVINVLFLLLFFLRCSI